VIINVAVEITHIEKERSSLMILDDRKDAVLDEAPELPVAH
jgi:hypothetical protein